MAKNSVKFEKKLEFFSKSKRIMAFKSTEFQILAWGGSCFGLNFEFYCIFDP